MAAGVEAWCESCREWRQEAQCPACGRDLADAEPPPVPWHFKVLVVGTVLYLGWWAVRGIMWLVGRF
ncbi:MAG: hypothetical protein M3404_11170 [Actinomycetota bacterium]|nr:hypothetical protein [Actinomycetota bacterium]